jgi:acetate---CoA ligase (ADP-forming)
LKYPLFSKTANLSILHKKEIGAVYGVVENITQAQTAYEKMRQFGNEVLFQELIDIDHEILVGLTNDPQFGLFLTIGLGGSYTNILADRVYVFLPTNKKRLVATWKRTKAYEAIKKIPGISEKVVDVMFSLQKIVMTHPEVKDLEINPLVINKSGVWAADVKLSLK